MDITLRQEEPGDYSEVERITYQAFRLVELPGRKYCDEHYLAHIMRDAPEFIPQLDYVAVAGGKLVGNIIYTKSYIEGNDGAKHEALTFGPLSVLPEYQKQGIGSMLVNHTIEKARQLGYRAILIFGHPQYYPKFGFQNAERYGITTAEGDNFDAFMALELFSGALNHINGRLRFAPVFDNLPKDQVDAFTKALLK